ncbi:hypothetical protein BST97_06275 [Nonlabens spongiae]|uniref:Glycosyltransferase 2-like domain-containing protein n=1 Tax=Nonlabens spongiae TaxID=331648 RepID=A0A1W6MJ58_9FLAO|nr:glycosyltransferase family 2 protein [Nonlabens spongiae]ARN77630.1 hypothetical protein BST97_06275 [Nonlabens spongiae]
MISICIPCYNDNPSHLVESLMKQMDSVQEFTEIIIYDDASQQVFEDIPHPKIRILRGEENIGDYAARKLLANKSSNRYILFLDADLGMAKNDFLKVYAEACHTNYDVIYGGICYCQDKPEKSQILRWKYGKSREEKKNIPREKLYECFVSASFLVDKEFFLSITENQLPNIYGSDLYLAAQFKREKASINFIHNPICHKGLETSIEFLAKSKTAVLATYILMKDEVIPHDHRPIQRAYLLLKKMKSTLIISKTISYLEKYLTRNLLSREPRLLFLDMIKLNEYIKLARSKPENSLIKQ